MSADRRQRGEDKSRPAVTRLRYDWAPRAGRRERSRDRRAAAARPCAWRESSGPARRSSIEPRLGRSWVRYAFAGRRGKSPSRKRADDSRARDTEEEQNHKPGRTHNLQRPQAKFTNRQRDAISAEWSVRAWGGPYVDGGGAGAVTVDICMILRVVPRAGTSSSRRRPISFCLSFSVRVRLGCGRADTASISRVSGDESFGIAKLEQGVTKPTWETVLSLCQALGVTCEAFTKPAEEKSPAKPGRPKKSKG